MKIPPSHVCTVLSNEPMGGGNFCLRLEISGEWRSSSPGQFVMLSPVAPSRLPSTDPLLPRPMAIYRREQNLSGSGVIVDVAYKVIGRGTALMRSALPGSSMTMVGPLGRGFSMPADQRGAVLVGGGTGIASLYEQARALSGQCPTIVLLGAQTAETILGRADFESLSVNLRVATEDGSLGSRGLVTELLPSALDEMPRAHVYACGPTPMMRAVTAITVPREIPCDVSIENNMACGIGVCLGCAIPLKAGAGFALVCTDGPVFSSGLLAWDGLP